MGITTLTQVFTEENICSSRAAIMQLKQRLRKHLCTTSSIKINSIALPVPWLLCAIGQNDGKPPSFFVLCDLVDGRWQGQHARASEKEERPTDDPDGGHILRRRCSALHHRYYCLNSELVPTCRNMWKYVMASWRPNVHVNRVASAS